MKRWTLSHQSIVITGAASGIGRELAIALAQRENSLWLIDQDPEGLSETRLLCDTGMAEIRISVCDLSQPILVKNLAESIRSNWPDLSILINNAGVGCYGAYDRFPSREVLRLMQINLLAPMQLSHQLIPVLLKQPRSHIVNISSMYGLFISPRSTPYHASKYGLIGFSEALRAEYHRTSLRVSTICPGFVRTSLYDSLIVTKKRSGQRVPPQWVCTTSKKVVNSTLKAIEYQQRLVIVGALARIGYHSTRLFPGLLDWLYSFRKSTPIDDQQQTIVINSVVDADNETESNSNRKAA